MVKEPRVVWRKRVGNVGTVYVSTWFGRSVNVVVQEYGKARMYSAATFNEKGEEIRADLTGKVEAVTGHKGYAAALEEALAVAVVQSTMQS